MDASWQGLIKLLGAKAKSEKKRKKEEKKAAKAAKKAAKAAKKQGKAAKLGASAVTKFAAPIGGDGSSDSDSSGYTALHQQVKKLKSGGILPVAASALVKTADVAKRQARCGFMSCSGRCHAALRLEYKLCVYCGTDSMIHLSQKLQSLR